MVCPVCIMTAAAPIIGATLSAAAAVKLTQHAVTARVPPPVLIKDCQKCKHFKNGLCVEYDVEARVARVDPNLCSQDGNMWKGK